MTSIQESRIPEHRECQINERRDYEEGETKDGSLWRRKRIRCRKRSKRGLVGHRKRRQKVKENSSSCILLYLFFFFLVRSDENEIKAKSGMGGVL